MYIYQDPDEYESICEYQTCDFHQKNPRVPFAGCTCSAHYFQRRRDPEEYAKLKHKRKVERLAQLTEEIEQLRYELEEEKV